MGAVTAIVLSTVLIFHHDPENTHGYVGAALAFMFEASAAALVFVERAFAPVIAEAIAWPDARPDLNAPRRDRRPSAAPDRKYSSSAPSESRPMPGIPTGARADWPACCNYA